MGLFASYHVRRKGISKAMGLWRRFCILLPPRAKECRAGARNIPARGMKGTSNGPSGTSAPTECMTGATAEQPRAVGDAGPYGVRDRRHGEISVGGVCPLGAFKRGTRERVAFSGGL